MTRARLRFPQGDTLEFELDDVRDSREPRFPIGGGPHVTFIG